MTILELHKFIFDLMEDIRYSLDKSGNPFVYGLRQRDKNRINSGYLFAGNDNYLSIKLSCDPCVNNRTSTVYLSIHPNCYSKLVIVYDKTSKLSQFYDNLAKNLSINLVQTNQYKVTYEHQITPKGTTDLVLGQSIRDFLINNYDKLIQPLVKAKFDVDFNDFRNSINKFSSFIEMNQKFNDPDYYQAKKNIQGNSSKTVTGTKVNTTTKTTAKKVNLHKNDLPLNLILYGPPGTGKTYNTVNKALKIILGETAYAAFVIKAKAQSNSDSKIERGFYTKEFNKLKDNGRIVFTTFHQSMGYEDFVEGIKPETDKNTQTVTYDVKNGILKDLCYNIIKENLKPNDKESVSNEQVEGVIKEKQFTPHENGFDNRLDRYVLIIDEINRGNVSQIFGELITLIEKDKRLGEDEVLTVKLPYSQKEFGVPNNLYIIGTMNTADRSVEALDTALRRRFSFEEMMPKYTDNDAPGIEKVICNYKMSMILKTINERVEVLKDREHQVGHSYFMGVNSTEELKAAFFDKIIPLLQEYFYGDYEKIQMVLGEGFVKQEKKDYAKLFAGRGDFDTLPDTLFSIADKDSMGISAFESAIHTLMK